MEQNDPFIPAQGPYYTIPFGRISRQQLIVLLSSMMVLGALFTLSRLVSRGCIGGFCRVAGVHVGHSTCFREGDGLETSVGKPRAILKRTPGGSEAITILDYDWEAKNSLRRIIPITMLIILCAGFVWLRHLPFGELFEISRRHTSISNATGVLEVFQVYQPVPIQRDNGFPCNREILLMDHVFAFSYGKPFIGYYEPPQCDFDTVRINLTVTSRGRQYDRLAVMYLGDIEVFRTSTAEPTIDGIVWTYIKDMSQYNALWKGHQKLIFDLGNLVNDVYTGTFNVTLTAHFSWEDNVKTADMILPISARRSASNSSSAFTLPPDDTTTLYQFPPTAARAVVSISACGQFTEEFWWSNVFSSDTESFGSTVGELYGYSPFREIQLYIDGILAGVVWPFPIIFTGGVAPGFWRPIVGIDAFDLREPEIDISPFLPLLTDNLQHSFEIKVVGVVISENGTATLSDSVGSYWVVTGNIFLYLDEDAVHSTPSRSGERLRVIAPAPKFTVMRHLVKNETGGNKSLSYSVIAERALSITSSDFSWNQSLSYSNVGVLDQQGLSQVNNQQTSGKASITPHGENKTSDEIAFEYPLFVSTTYSTTDTSFMINAEINRGLDIEATGGTGISTYTLISGPLQLHTNQWGKASYQSIKGGNSTSSGDTTQIFVSKAGESYRRSVHAINGSVVFDTDPRPETISPYSTQCVLGSPGRDSVRSILGRGPWNLEE